MHSLHYRDKCSARQELAILFVGAIDTLPY
jgi:hypothetical protein